MLDGYKPDGWEIKSNFILVTEYILQEKKKYIYNSTNLKFKRY